jgi:hypothetical protein
VLGSQPPIFTASQRRDTIGLNTYTFNRDTPSIHFNKLPALRKRRFPKGLDPSDGRTLAPERVSILCLS